MAYVTGIRIGMRKKLFFQEFQSVIAAQEQPGGQHAVEARTKIGVVLND